MGIVFGKYDTDRYILYLEVEEKAKAAILQAMKDGLPKEARRVDVMDYLLDEAKRWIKSQQLNL